MSTLKVSTVNLNSSENTKISIAANDMSMSLFANNSEVLTISNDARVGIGTNSPSDKLQISSTNENVDFSGRVDSSTAGHRPSFRFIHTGGDLTTPSPTDARLGLVSFLGVSSAGSLSTYAYFDSFLEGAPTAGSESSYIKFLTTSSGVLEERLRIHSNGNIGIGTSTPSYKFDVNGSVNAASFLTTGNVLIGRTDSTVGQGVKLDVNGAINTSAILVNGSTLTSATQADQEANTSTSVYVSPAVQQFHKSAAKVWGSFLANSTTIQQAYNVSSLADTATGQLTVNFGVTFSATTYAVLVGIELNSTTVAQSATYSNKATTSVRLYSVVEAGSGADPSTWSVAIFGDI